MSDKLKILFLCTGNSCRSQMAEGWAQHLIGEVIEPYSAGIIAHGLNPRAVAVMKETGIDISHHSSKDVGSVTDIHFDHVITVCSHAEQSCPVFPGKIQATHVHFDDPPSLAKSANSEDETLAHFSSRERRNSHLYRNIATEII